MKSASFDAAGKIRAAGFRATRARIALLEYLSRLRTPESIQEISAALKKELDQVTAYRILDSFKKAGLVRELDLRQGRLLYELSDEGDHHHVVCKKCSLVEEFHGCDYERIAQKAIKQVHFATIDSHAVELFGICSSCSRA